MSDRLSSINKCIIIYVCDPVTYFECDVKISDESVYPFQSYETFIGLEFV